MSKWYFVPGLGAIGGVPSDQLARLLARTDTESLLALDQSRIRSLDSSSSTARWSCSQTPAYCHWRSRRHAVCPNP